MHTKITSRVSCGLLLSLLFLTTSFGMPFLTVAQADSLLMPHQVPADTAHQEPADVAHQKPADIAHEEPVGITYQEIENLWENAAKRKVENDKTNNGSTAESAPTNVEIDVKEQESAAIKPSADTTEFSKPLADTTEQPEPSVDTIEPPIAGRQSHVSFKKFSGRTRAHRHTEGIYPTRKGMILVTKDKFQNLIPLGHAAIIYGRNIVIEAFGDGVQYGKNDWNRSRKTAYGVSVKKTTELQDAQAAEWCKNQIGKPYNFNYLNIKTRDRFYCSQLIWAAYLDNYGINIDTPAWGSAIHPCEILNSNEVKIIYRQS